MRVESAGPVSAEALEGLARIVGREGAEIAAGGESAAIPDDLLRALRGAVAAMRAGEAFTLVREESVLTTQAAADLLNVSRPYLVGLLESGAIPFHRAGTHRRVRAADLLAYRAVRDAERRRILDELFDAIAADGAYE